MRPGCTGAVRARNCLAWDNQEPPCYMPPQPSLSLKPFLLYPPHSLFNLLSSPLL